MTDESREPEPRQPPGAAADSPASPPWWSQGSGDPWGPPQPPGSDQVGGPDYQWGQRSELGQGSPPPAAQPTQAYGQQPWGVPPGGSTPPWEEPGYDSLGQAPPPARRRLGLLIGAAVAVALVASTVGGGVGYLLADRADDRQSVSANLGAPPSEQVQRPPDSIAGIADLVLPSVVSIQAGRATGSGFVVQADGYILTNNHVVEGAAPSGNLAVRFQDDKVKPATIVGRSLTYDLAVLKVDGGGLKAVTFGNSDQVVVGDPVVAVGSPLGLEGTVTSGIVSALNRPVTAGEQGIESFVSAIQTDAAINPGNSGGPLTDGSGRVIGVNSSIATLGSSNGEGSIGLGFAIPINQGRRVAEQLIEDGFATYPILGVVPDPASVVNGAQVLRLTSGAPAEGAGIQPGDVIIGVDDNRVNDAAELIVQIRAKDPGQEVKIRYERGGKELETTVRLGSQREQLG
jgi:putative serine protease PepD